MSFVFCAVVDVVCIFEINKVHCLKTLWRMPLAIAAMSPARTFHMASHACPHHGPYQKSLVLHGGIPRVARMESMQRAVTLHQHAISAIELRLHCYPISGPGRRDSNLCSGKTQVPIIYCRSSKLIMFELALKLQLQPTSQSN